jgi:para-nitrobenzyl esterase
VSEIVVDAPAGTLRGVADGGVRRFLGIPYAEAPIGPLRFAPPRRRPRLDGVFAADRHGATPQRVPLFDATTVPEPSIPGDDTLTLDVFAPDEDGDASILFWIHGGGYVAGSPASPWYDGGAFARAGVVVVNASYRLGIDGFGHLPGAVDNRGLRDLICALEWLQVNAGALGGDPSRITIAGQSAGGGAVLALLASPATTGLFRAAISISGVDVTLDRAEAGAATASVAAAMGVPATVDGFGPRDDGTPMRTMRRLRDAAPSPRPLDVGPVVGDDIVPDPVPVGLRRRGTDVPLLIGATADEFDGGPTPEDPDRPPMDDTARLAAKADGTRMTDTLFRAAAVRAARARDDAAAGTWLYSFDWPSPVTGGATHCIDIPFLFDNLTADGVTAALGTTPPATLATAMHDDVLRFVRGAEPAWPRARGRLGDAARIYGPGEEPTVARGSFDPCVRHAVPSITAGD